VVLSPREIYAVAGLFGLIAAGVMGVRYAAHRDRAAAPLGADRDADLSRTA
jgi:hypothetical protein